jgi:hypothetical protein
MVVEDKHMIKLKESIKEEVTHMFEQALDFCQVACPEPNFKQLRSKILRVGNNCIRNLHKKIEDQYKITYVPAAEDVIEFQRRK